MYKTIYSGRKVSNRSFLAFRNRICVKNLTSGCVCFQKMTRKAQQSQNGVMTFSRSRLINVTVYQLFRITGKNLENIATLEFITYDSDPCFTPFLLILRDFRQFSQLKPKKFVPMEFLVILQFIFCEPLRHFTVR